MFGFAFPGAMAVLAVCTALILGGPADAHACTCAGYRQELIGPKSGEVGVPLNTKLWVFGPLSGLPEPLRLFRADGWEVSLTWLGRISTSGREALHVFEPAVPLDAVATYRIQFGVKTWGLFETGSDFDWVPPAPPSGKVSSTHITKKGELAPCGSAYYAYVHVTGRDLIHVANVSGSAELHEGEYNGVVSAANRDEQIMIGATGCRTTWPNAAPGASTSARFASYDLAGNFSGWGDPLAIQLPSQVDEAESGGLLGCGGSSAEEAAVWLLLPGLGLPFRRRKGPYSPKRSGS